MHPLKRTLQSPRLLTETKMTASKFPRETARHSPVPLNNLTFECAFCNKLPCSHLVVTWHSGTSCCMYRTVVRAPMSCILLPSGCGEGGGGCGGGCIWGGCRLSVAAERNDCRLFLTAFDRYFSAVQTGRYGYNNRRARSSCPSFLFLCLSMATLTQWHVHVWTGCVRRGMHSWGFYTSYQLHRAYKTGPLNLVSQVIYVIFFSLFLHLTGQRILVKNLPSDLKCFLAPFYQGLLTHNLKLHSLFFFWPLWGSGTSWKHNADIWWAYTVNASCIEYFSNLLRHPVNTEQHHHSFGVVCPATWQTKINIYSTTLRLVRSSRTPQGNNVAL